MFNLKNKVIPTPSHSCDDLENSVGWAFLPNNSVKSTLTPALSQKRGNRCAFTLAEVLITLVIIGVIAAITVPTLMNKTNNQEYVSKLKKAYSTLAQATNLIIAEEGIPRADKGGWASSVEHLSNLYKKHLHNAKDCTMQEGCFNQVDGDNWYRLLSGKKIANNWNSNTSRGKLVLADGTQVMFEGVYNDCSQSSQGSNNVCAWIFVDINGARKPNMFGRDGFYFVLKENGLYPDGCDDLTYCTSTDNDGNKTGWGCTCKVLREGAINY